MTKQLSARECAEYLERASSEFWWCHQAAAHLRRLDRQFGERVEELEQENAELRALIDKPADQLAGILAADKIAKRIENCRKHGEADNAALGIADGDGAVFAGKIVDQIDTSAEPVEKSPENRHVQDARDAARYRWLQTRTRGIYDVDTKQAFVLPHVPVIKDQNIMRGSVAQHLDAAIDAAMQAKDGGL